MFDSGVLVPFKLHYEETKELSSGDIVHSEVAHAGGHRGRIRCDPQGKKKADKQGEYISIFLELMSKCKGVKAIFEAFVVDKDGEPFSSHEERCVQVYPPEGFEAWGWPQFAKRSDLESQYVVNGWVTIVWGVVVVRDDSIAVPSSDIENHLGRLVDCGDGSDVSFVVDGETFPAHRAVLAARSSVFKAELFGSMAESTMSRVTLEDIDAATFKVFLRFVYTDALSGDDELDDSATEMYERLLAVADRYAMDRLKLICAKKLWDGVTVDNVAATLCCAETYSCLELKNKCIAFFAEEKNFREAVLTDGFVGLVQKFPSIICELFF
ncbi:hypothetical protein CFC21_102539 [Triticum aestivum]|uniref:BTB domain-containing protein n=2 Tax=Triticum aestivum TaxID=4565 RepID=A0A9R1M5J3_WHEAT|nr:BTB/POZ and MATH domain-containing protein 1-like [Triticum aestivum]KAF7101145.1 hypothetical protein CFC21_102539 [Triticum aestivum]